MFTMKIKALLLSLILVVSMAASANTLFKGRAPALMNMVYEFFTSKGKVYGSREVRPASNTKEGLENVINRYRGMPRSYKSNNPLIKKE